MNARVFVFSTLVVIISTAVALSQDTSSGSEKTRLKRSSRISVKYEKSKDLTTVRLKQMTITRLSQEKEIANNIPLHQMDLDAWFSFPGLRPTKSIDEVVVRFHATASNYVFLRQQPVIAALDREIAGQDRAFSLGMTEYKSASPKFNSVYEEDLILKMPSDALVKMSKAASLEFFVGPVVYKLTDAQHEALREMSGYLTISGYTSLQASAR